MQKETNDRLSYHSTRLSTIHRYSGHSMSDPGTSYRSRDEVQEVRQTRDPITSFREKIITKNLATAEEIKV